MSLSPSEENVATYVMMGLSSKEIGERLFVTEKTIKFHLTNIYSKSGVKSRAEFVAMRSGISNVETRQAIMSTSNEKPLHSVLNQGARQVQVVSKTQEDKIQFIDKTFKVGETLDHLHKMMKDVTKQEMNANTVNAACNCVARLNETINTAIQAAKFLNER
jgi:DNA-binding CsgD family transcriptional regulator